jgi:SAM-dependent methyltransferase
MGESEIERRAWRKEARGGYLGLMSSDDGFGLGFSSLALAYEGVEGRGSFADHATLEAYRALALQKTDAQLAFLKSKCPTGGRLIEIGCGNGRLPIALAQLGLIDDGIGLDLSDTRVAFARTWAADLHLDDRLRFEVADALSYEPDVTACSLAVCITGTLGYFDAYVPGSSRKILDTLRRSLAANGLLLLELYPHPHELRLLRANDGHIRVWSELNASDPWRFYLSDLRLESEEVLVHTKTFVHRTDGLIDAGRSERLILYTPETISTLLLESGFSNVRCMEGWSEQTYAGGQTMVATASP